MADTTRTNAGASKPTVHQETHLEGHGNSVAAWTGVGIVLLGSLISCLGLIFDQMWMFFGGFVVIALGAVVGKVMSRMGYGAQVHEDPPDSPRQGIR